MMTMTAHTSTPTLLRKRRSSSEAGTVSICSKPATTLGFFMSVSSQLMVSSSNLSSWAIPIQNIASFAFAVSASIAPCKYSALWQAHIEGALAYLAAVNHSWSSVCAMPQGSAVHTCHAKEIQTALTAFVACSADCHTGKTFHAVQKTLHIVLMRNAHDLHRQHC